MKTYIWLALVLVIIPISCSTANKQNYILDNVASISGTINANNLDTIKMVEVYKFKSSGDFHIPWKKRSVISTTHIKNGKFKFNDINVREPRAINLLFGDSLNTYVVAFLEPGNIKINISIKDTIIYEKKPDVEVRAQRKGSINNSLFTEYRNKRFSMDKEPKYRILKGYDKQAFAEYPNLDSIYYYEKQYGD
ncbi:DUF4369 domain-containing protein, partial [Cellulophaga fucicola]|uniref:DUF4369 domain-containing protein n=1 Tax=Cellulophaga fucicola TaxID=76595 RepID=UPI003EB92C21